MTPLPLSSCYLLCRFQITQLTKALLLDTGYTGTEDNFSMHKQNEEWNEWFQAKEDWLILINCWCLRVLDFMLVIQLFNFFFLQQTYLYKLIPDLCYDRVLLFFILLRTDATFIASFVFYFTELFLLWPFFAKPILCF